MPALRELGLEADSEVAKKGHYRVITVIDSIPHQVGEDTADFTEAVKRCTSTETKDPIYICDDTGMRVDWEIVCVPKRRIDGPPIAVAHAVLGYALQHAMRSMSSERVERIQSRFKARLDQLVQDLFTEGEDWDDEWPK